MGLVVRFFLRRFVVFCRNFNFTQKLLCRFYFKKNIPIEKSTPLMLVLLVFSSFYLRFYGLRKFQLGDFGPICFEFFSFSQILNAQVDPVFSNWVSVIKKRRS